MLPLIAVAHGSRDPRSARVMAALVDKIRSARPDLDVRLCFLDLNAPSVEQTIDAVAAEGSPGAVLVPLLLGSAFHARIDLPTIVSRARSRHPGLALTQADVLGGDARLSAVLRDRVIEAGFEPHDGTVGVVTAAVGSSNAQANHRSRRFMAAVATGTDWITQACFATTDPRVDEAVRALHERGATRVAIAPWFLAPGLLTDRIGAAAQVAAPKSTCVNVLGAHPMVARAVLDRYDEAVQRLHVRSESIA